MWKQIYLTENKYFITQSYLFLYYIDYGHSPEQCGCNNFKCMYVWILNVRRWHKIDNIR